jgi:hypothetical protein
MYQPFRILDFYVPAISNFGFLADFMYQPFRILDFWADLRTSHFEFWVFMYQPFRSAACCMLLKIWALLIRAESRLSMLADDYGSGMASGRPLWTATWRNGT